MDGTYDLKLVALSVVIATTASYTGLDLGHRVRRAHTGGKHPFWLWLIAGSCAIGAGIWSMHFVGMLAFHLPIPMGYDLWLTLLSLLIAIGTSGCALWTLRTPTITRKTVAGGTMLFAAAIAGMHYTGMAAMRLSPPIDYDPLILAASVMIAAAAALAALWIDFRVRTKKTLSAVLARHGGAVMLGLAMVGLHYTAMAASRFAPDSVSLAAGSAGGMDHLSLVAIVSLITFVIVLTTLVTSAVDAHFAEENERLAGLLRTSNEELRNVALHDQLTGLPTRVLLLDRLQHAMHQAERSGASCACLLIDLDRFKPVNDTFGHHVGDELLKEATRRLKGYIRAGDTAARIGGDEFVAVLSQIGSATDAMLVAARIVAELSRPFVVGDRTLSIACSVGVVLYPADGANPGELLDKADQAMYRAKTSGGNRYTFYGAAPARSVA